jgi:hypothetical protein
MSQESGEKESGRFILFDVFEFDEKVGKVALSTRWSERDVLTELESKNFPVEGHVSLMGWPSTQKFELVVTTERTAPVLFKFVNPAASQEEKAMPHDDRKVTLRRTLEQALHCVEEALSVVEQGEDARSAMGDVQQAVSLLQGKALGDLKEMADRQVARAPGE